MYIASPSEHLSSYTSAGLGGAAVVPNSSGRDDVSTTDDRAQLTSSWQEEDELSDGGGGVGGVGAADREAARYFDFQKTRYVWDQAKGSFRKLE